MIFSQKNLDYFGKSDFFNCDSNERKNNSALLEVTSLEHKGTENDTLECQFDAFCKKLLKNEARNTFQEEEHRLDNEKPFSALSESELAELQTLDEYPVERYRYDILGETVAVRDDQLGGALDALPEHWRAITLLAYFLDMTDAQIGMLLKVGRSTIQYQRRRSLEQLKRHMEEHKDDE